MLEDQQLIFNQLSDELLFEIFKNVNTRTLLNLMGCDNRLYNLILDTGFWIHVDLGREPITLDTFEYVLEHIHTRTSSIKLPALLNEEGFNIRFVYFLKYIRKRCKDLKSLQLQGLELNNLKLTYLPSTLQHLTLMDCSLKYFFPTTFVHLVHLNELEIENCFLVEENFLCTLSQLPELRKLSLKGSRYSADFVRYCDKAMNFGFGFKKLEFLDMRYTTVNDFELQCFSSVKTLKELRLECPEEININYFLNIEKNQVALRMNQSISQTHSWKVKRINRNDNRPAKYLSHADLLLYAKRSKLVHSLKPDNFKETLNNILHWEKMIGNKTTCEITDNGICCFGINYATEENSNNEMDDQQHNRCSSNLEHLSVRNYKLITDNLLRHLLRRRTYLKYLDLSGTSVTLQGIRSFRKLRPKCEIIADHLSEM